MPRKKNIENDCLIVGNKNRPTSVDTPANEPNDDQYCDKEAR